MRAHVIATSCILRVKGLASMRFRSMLLGAIAIVSLEVGLTTRSFAQGWEEAAPIVIGIVEKVISANSSSAAQRELEQNFQLINSKLDHITDLLQQLPNVVKAALQGNCSPPLCWMSDVQGSLNIADRGFCGSAQRQCVDLRVGP